MDSLCRAWSIRRITNREKKSARLLAANTASCMSATPRFPRWRLPPALAAFQKAVPRVKVVLLKR